MKNLILLSVNLSNPNALYEEYLRLYNNKYITNPMIFTDYCSIVVHKNIPVFNLSYLKQLNRLTHSPNITCYDFDFETLDNLCRFGNYFIIDTLNKPIKDYYTISMQDLSNECERT